MVLNLYVFEQLSHKEIARLLGITPGTSASQYARAKQELAKHINNYLKNNKL
jgi:RNA polymerase sigma-70 factor (ECF subfamily)